MFDRPPRAVLLDAGETLLYAPQADAIIAALVAGGNGSGAYDDGAAGGLE